MTEKALWIWAWSPGGGGVASALWAACRSCYIRSLTTVTYRHMPSHTATYGHVVCLLCGRPPEIVDAVTEATLAVELCEYVNA